MFTLCRNAACTITVVVSRGRARFLCYSLQRQGVPYGCQVDRCEPSVNISDTSKLYDLDSVNLIEVYISWQVSSDYSTTLFERCVFSL